MNFFGSYYQNKMSYLHFKHQLRLELIADFFKTMKLK